MRLPDLAFHLLSVLLEFFVAYLFLIRGLFRRFLFVNLLLLGSAAVSIARYATLSHYEMSSDEYMYVYFASDALLSALLLLAVCEVGARAVGVANPRRVSIVWSTLTILSMACFSFLTISTVYSGNTLFTGVCFEFSSDTFIACFFTCLVFMFWHLRYASKERMAVRLVAVLGVYTSIFFFLTVAFQFVRAISEFTLLPLLMMGAWLPLGCGFTAISESAS